MEPNQPLRIGRIELDQTQTTPQEARGLQVGRLEISAHPLPTLPFDGYAGLAEQVQRAQPDLRDVPQEELSAVLSAMFPVPDVDTLAQLAAIATPLGQVISWGYRNVSGWRDTQLAPPPLRTYPEEILAAMCQTHIQKRYHRKAALTSFTTTIERLSYGQSDGPLVQYEVRVTVRGKTYVFEIDAAASVSRLIREQGEQEEDLPLPGWMDND